MWASLEIILRLVFLGGILWLVVYYKVLVCKVCKEVYITSMYISIEDNMNTCFNMIISNL